MLCPWKLFYHEGRLQSFPSSPHRTLQSWEGGVVSGLEQVLPFTARAWSSARKGYSSSSVTLAYWARSAAFLCCSSWDTSLGFTTILACFSIMLAMAWTSSGRRE